MISLKRETKCYNMNNCDTVFEEHLTYLIVAFAQHQTTHKLCTTGANSTCRAGLWDIYVRESGEMSKCDSVDGSIGEFVIHPS